MRLTGLDTAFVSLDRDVSPVHLGALATFRPVHRGDPDKWPLCWRTASVHYLGCPGSLDGAASVVAELMIARSHEAAHCGNSMSSREQAWDRLSVLFKMHKAAPTWH